MKLKITVEGVAYNVDVEVLDDSMPAASSAAPTSAAAPAAAASTGGAEVPSPIAGTVMSVAVNEGDSVSEGDTLLVLEAMKMESNVASPHTGVVAEVFVSTGDSVTAGQPLVRFQ